MSYRKTLWVEGKTPISAEKLNNIENGIEELYNTQVKSSDIISDSGISTSISDNGKIKIQINQDELNDLVVHPELSEGNGIKIIKVYEGSDIDKPSDEDVPEEDSEEEEVIIDDSTLIFNENTDNLGMSHIHLYYDIDSKFYYNYNDGIFISPDSNLVTDESTISQKNISKIIIDSSCTKLEKIQIEEFTGELDSLMSLDIRNLTGRTIEVTFPILKGGLYYMTYHLLPGISREYRISLEEVENGYNYDWRYIEYRDLPERNDEISEDDLIETPEIHETRVKELMLSIDPRYINSIVEHPKNGDGILLKDDTYSVDMEYINENIEHPVKYCKSGDGINIELSDDEENINFSLDNEYFKSTECIKVDTTDGIKFTVNMDYINTNVDHPVKYCKSGDGINVELSDDGENIEFSLDEEYLVKLIKDIIEGRK